MHCNSRLTGSVSAAQQPHATGFNRKVSWQLIPMKHCILCMAIRIAIRTILIAPIPETCHIRICTVSSVSEIIISIVCREFRSVERSECIVDNTASEAVHVHLVLRGLAVHCERVVLGPVPLTVDCRLQVEAKFVSSVARQQVKQFIANPINYYYYYCGLRHSPENCRAENFTSYWGTP